MFESSSDLLKQLRDWRLTTAEILYRLPDHPSILQSYIWQEYDLAPRYPTLHKFLGFWEQEIEGKLYQVNVTSCGVITASDLTHARAEFLLN